MARGGESFQWESGATAAIRVESSDIGSDAGEGIRYYCPMAPPGKKHPVDVVRDGGYDCRCIGLPSPNFQERLAMLATATADKNADE
jgi:hypothetical protein